MRIAIVNDLALARETLRRIKYTVLSHRQGKVLEPLGD